MCCKESRSVCCNRYQVQVTLVVIGYEGCGECAVVAVAVVVVVVGSSSRSSGSSTSKSL